MNYKRRHFISGFMVLLSAFMVVSILGYSPLDPSWNHAVTSYPSNYLWYPGALFSDFILQLLGLSSYILAFIFFFLAFRVWFDSGSISILRIFFILLATISFALAFSTYPTNEEWPFYIGYGGIIGDILFSIILDEQILLIQKIVIFIVAILLLSIACGIKISEIKWLYHRLRYGFEMCLFSTRYTFFCLINLYRKFRKQEPVSVEKVAASKPSVTKPKAVVEERKKVKKRKAEQQSLGLIDDLYKTPPLDLLMKEKQKLRANDQSSLEQNAKLLKTVLADFGVYGEIIRVRPGPVVTLYELEPSPGTKSSRVIGLADDISRSMSAVSARISVIPGKNLLGIELPNTDREIVYFRELLETEEYKDKRIKLPMVLGKDIGGGAVMADLSRMPHLLVAGTTGSGKSVAINAMILSFLYRMSPEECKFIMIDPKMLELSVYDGIPYLLSPVVTEPGKAVVALKWATREMEDRYRLMSNLGVRNMAGYNKRIEDALRKGEKLERTVQTGYDSDTGNPIFEKQELEMKKMPYIVIIVDEMADLMLTAGKEIEASVQRLAQMARAAGIHLIMATQRPSVDVITGVIKANFPTRISFQVTSKVDSRTILGVMGAEQLLGMGDMLYMSGGAHITRVHGPFVDDSEVSKVVEHLKELGEPEYIEEVTDEDGSFTPEMIGGGSGSNDLYDQAVAIVIRDKKASTSYIQRQLKIGYNRAADLIDRMESQGVISAANHAGKREVLVGNS